MPLQSLLPVAHVYKFDIYSSLLVFTRQLDVFFFSRIRSRAAHHYIKKRKNICLQPVVQKAHGTH